MACYAVSSLPSHHVLPAALPPCAWISLRTAALGRGTVSLQRWLVICFLCYVEEGWEKLQLATSGVGPRRDRFPPLPGPSLPHTMASFRRAQLYRGPNKLIWPILWGARVFKREVSQFWVCVMSGVGWRLLIGIHEWPAYWRGQRDSTLSYTWKVFAWNVLLHHFIEVLWLFETFKVKENTLSSSEGCALCTVCDVWCIPGVLVVLMFGFQELAWCAFPPQLSSSVLTGPFMHHFLFDLDGEINE